jgi:cell division protease FtsH
VTGSLKQAVVVWAVMFGLLSVMLASASTNQRPPDPTFGQFLTQLERHELSHVELRTRDNSVRTERTTGPAYTVGYPPEYGTALVGKLRATDTRFDVKPNGSAVSGILRLLLPIVLLGGFWLLVLRRSARRGVQLRAFGRAPARQPAADGPKTGFDDVAGADEAVEELPRGITT